MDSERIRELSAPVPRYTSYPTAPHFHAGVGADDYRRWLDALVPASKLSLYIHIPYCDSLCWFCACNTKIVRRYEPIARYLDHLRSEIAQVAAAVPRPHSVTHVHWGGGSPDILAPADIVDLAAAVRSRFDFATGVEFAAEIDPRALTAEKVEAFAEAGLNRVSIGVQDFDPRVQAAINRMQSFEVTRDAVEQFRRHGVGSVNIDLVYGLPHQTPIGAEQTVEAVISLDPDRLALFGYAHLPDRIRHQRMIDDEAVPDVVDRFDRLQAMSERLVRAGYQRVGLDHFAKPTDSLAKRPLRRNFQGYTVDDADALLGLGVSAIGRLPQGYVQNAAAIAEYGRLVEAEGLATVRGFALAEEDRARAMAIERLMCDLAFPARALERDFPAVAASVIAEAAAIESDLEGLVEPDLDGFRVTEAGRPFLRTICARFDAYLGRRAGHSVGV